MTILDFQKALMEDVKHTLKGIGTTDISGKMVDGVNVYAQDLPAVLSGEGDDSKFFPYAIVRLYDGMTEDDNSPWTVTADIHFGVYDADEDNQGHQHIMTMCQRVVDRFAYEPLLDKQYRAQQDMEWALQEDNTYPYYFGGVRIKFSVPKIERRDPFYGSY